MKSLVPHVGFGVRWFFMVLGMAGTCLVVGGPAWGGITYDQVILGDNPTAYWRFEETSTSQPAADWATSDGAQNGVYTGTATLGPGKVGGALYVTPGGTEGGYVRADNVNIAKAFTFEAWVRSETPNWNAFGWIASAREPNGLILHPSYPNTKSWSGYAVTNTTGYPQIATHTPTDIQGWHHYAISYDGATPGRGRLYYDGVLVAQNLSYSSARDAADTISLFLGVDSSLRSSVDRRGNGAIDEAALFLSELTPEQIRRHYSAAFGAYVFDGPTSPALDFQGHFVYAVDVGNLTSGTIGRIGDAVFTGHAASGTPQNGVTITYTTLLGTWGNKPEYGNTPEANLLETMMHSIVYTPSTNQNGVKVELDVVPGYTYHLQLIFSENDPALFSLYGGRSFDILVDGQTLFDDFTASGMVGTFTGSPTLGVVFSTLVRPQSNKLTIQLLPTSPLYNNHDPILNAFTLELVPEPSTLLMLGLAGLLVVPAGLRLRRRRI